MSAKVSQSAVKKSPLRRADEDGRAGARAGAKARRREAEEGAAQTAAILEAERTGRASTWVRTYVAGTDAETGERIIRQETMREDARHHLTGAELLSEARHAARLAASRLERRHGIPELQPGEVADLAAELATRILEDGNGELPRREKISREYLVRRAAGFVLDDPERVNADAADAEPTLADIADRAAGKERSRFDRHDSMLNRGIDGTPDAMAAGAEIAGLSDRTYRAACHLALGGTVRGDWSSVWGVTEGYAATRVVPEGAAKLRADGGKEARRMRAATRLADLLDRDGLDHWAASRAAIERGLQSAPRPPRALKEHRPRLEPDFPAPVRTRTDRRIIRSAARRAKEAEARGWTAPLK